MSATGTKFKAGSDNFKDYTRDALSAGWQIGKDENKNLAAKKLTSVSDKIDHIFQSTVDDWKSSLEAINKAVFSGDQTSISILTKLLRDGESGVGRQDRNLSTGRAPKSSYTAC
jgi:hypothetical protein